jgi:hypothetical protein
MNPFRILTLFVPAGLALAVSACAGPPDPSEKMVSSRHCEHGTGSLLCTNDNDMAIGDTSQPGVTSHFNGQKGN